MSNDTAYAQFLNGNVNALSPVQRDGWAVFKWACTSSHRGPDLTDDRFHKVDTKPPASNDRGVAELTGKRSDEGKFRTPSLRHVTLTAPYFHDGTAPDLPTAIKRHKGIPMTDEDVGLLVEFLRSTEYGEGTVSDDLSFPKGKCEGR